MRIGGDATKRDGGSMVAKERRPRVQSLERALDLLEVLASVHELGVSELAARTGLVPSTAHRLLATLTDRRYVAAERGRYRLGPRLRELTEGRTDPIDRLREMARPHLQAIQRATGETANLIVLEGVNAVYVDQVEGSRMIRMFTEVGSGVLAHTTGGGKAILAALPAERVAALYGARTLERLTPHTLTTLAALEEDIARIRRRGFAIDDEEHEEGVSCVAAVILAANGEPVAALSISGPSPRIVNAATADLGELLRRHAEQISAALENTSQVPEPADSPDARAAEGPPISTSN